MTFSRPLSHLLHFLEHMEKCFARELIFFLDSAVFKNMIDGYL